MTCPNTTNNVMTLRTYQLPVGSPTQIGFTAIPIPTPTLIFSDNPETLRKKEAHSGTDPCTGKPFPDYARNAPSVGGTLWNHVVTNNGQTTSYRLYLYHGNHLDAVNLPVPLAPVTQRVFGININNTGRRPKGASVKVQNLRYQFGDDNANFCIAEAALTGQLGANAGNNLPFPNSRKADKTAPVTVIAGEVFTIWNTQPMNYGTFASGIFEFDIVPQGIADYTLSTVYNVPPAQSTLTGITRRMPTPVPEDPLNTLPIGEWEGHGRGTWPYSQIQIALQQPYNVMSGPAYINLADFSPNPCPPIIKPTVLADDENLFLATKSQDTPTHAKPNKGLYGVDQEIIISAYNPDSTPHRLVVRLWATRVSGPPPPPPPLDNKNKNAANYFGYVARGTGNQVAQDPHTFEGQTRGRVQTGGVTNTQGLVRFPDTYTDSNGVQGLGSRSLVNLAWVLDFIVPANTPISSPARYSFRLHHAAESTLPVGVLLDKDVSQTAGYISG